MCKVAIGEEVEHTERNKEYLKEYYDALLMPELIPNKTDNNLDLQCSFKTMFVSDKARNDFSKFFKDTCYLQNSCKINYEAMNFNTTKDDGTWEMKSNKLSELISIECFERIFEV